jgi:ABC-type transporter Mla MlaB component
MPKRGRSTTSSENAVVAFSGPLVVRTAKATHEALCAAFKAPGAVELNLTEVSEVDLSFVQIVEAARRSAAAAGREIRLSNPAEGALRDVLDLGGFLAPGDAARLAFWTHEKAA